MLPATVQPPGAPIPARGALHLRDGMSFDAWVARRFPVSRRRDTVSFQHHAEVAALPEPEQHGRRAAGRAT